MRNAEGKGYDATGPATVEFVPLYLSFTSSATEDENRVYFTGLDSARAYEALSGVSST